MSFPGEDSAFQLTLSQLGGKVNLVDLQLASQRHLQGLIDQELFDELLTFLDISGRARLNALAGSSDTSSWLRAPPIASLGLQIPRCDFCIACQLWLGIASFPADPPTRCPCGSQIDPPGYHLLSCGHGPWRIKRHDALRDTLYQALLLDNPEAAREQRLSGLTKKRPGDVFHPSFANGRPTFFDVSVRSPLTLGNINIASQQPGWAGLCGEIEKENIHANSVEQSGGAFIPLVVETFGLWTPFARQQLRKIASGTAVYPSPRLQITSFNSSPSSFGCIMPE